MDLHLLCIEWTKLCRWKKWDRNLLWLFKSAFCACVCVCVFVCDCCRSEARPVNECRKKAQCNFFVCVCVYFTRLVYSLPFWNNLWTFSFLTMFSKNPCKVVDIWNLIKYNFFFVYLDPSKNIMMTWPISLNNCKININLDFNFNSNSIDKKLVERIIKVKLKWGDENFWFPLSEYYYFEFNFEQHVLFNELCVCVFMLIWLTLELLYNQNVYVHTYIWYRYQSV